MQHVMDYLASGNRGAIEVRTKTMLRPWARAEIREI
jgi:hypothetical protein